MAKINTQAVEKVEKTNETSNTNTNTNTAAAPATQPAETSNEIMLSKDQQSEFDKLTTKSSRIRYLAKLNHKNGPIAKFMSKYQTKPMLYQHVRNVLNQPLKSQTNT